MRRHGECRFWAALIIFAALNIIVFNVMIMTSADDLKVQYIPDDAYYYLTLSRNFSSSGLWTFDSGVSVTSGFHPLFAYLLSSAYSLLRLDTNSFLTCGIVLSLFFALSSVVVICLWGLKYKNTLFLMFLALVISTRNFVYNTISVTEWSLTVLISSLYYVWYFAKCRNQVVKLSDFIVLFVLGLLGSLARLDIGLLPFSVSIAAFVFSLIATTSKGQSRFAFVGLLGALAGLLLGFVHNYIFTGEILQSSAKMKAYWAQLASPDFYAVPLLIGLIIGFAGFLSMVGLMVVATLSRFIQSSGACYNTKNYIIHSRSKRFSPETQNTLSSDNTYNLMLVTSAGVCMLGYLLFYLRNAAVQPWYTANLIGPVLMLIFAISNHRVIASLYERGQFLFGPLFLSALIFNLLHLYPISAFNAPWPHQKFMFDAGVYLAENPLDCHIGAWNAGIIGYYEGGHVVNLDGLVNNDIHFYAVNNDLPVYLSNKDICYIIDFERMLTTESLRVRGGYDDAEFLASLQPVTVFDDGEYEWRYLTLYYWSP
jgi:hypothetical protein